MVLSYDEYKHLQFLNKDTFYSKQKNMQGKECLTRNGGRVQVVSMPGSRSHERKTAGNTKRLLKAHLCCAFGSSKSTAPKLEWLRVYTASFHKTESKNYFVFCLVPSEIERWNSELLRAHTKHLQGFVFQNNWPTNNCSLKPSSTYTSPNLHADI